MKLLGTKMHIDAPRDDVFAFMADVENELAWNPDVRSIRRIGVGPVTSGTEWDATYRGLGPMRVRLDAYEPTQQLAFSTTGPRMDMRFSFHFRPVDDGAFTEITVDLDVQPKGLTKLAGPFLRPVMRRTFAHRPEQLAAGIRTTQARES